jgi:hypothetical protein
MLPRYEPQKKSPFHEYVGLLDQIMGVQIAKDEEKISNDKLSPKIDLSPVTGKITGIRISKSMIRQLIYKGEPYPVCPYKVYHTMLFRDIATPAVRFYAKRTVL